MLRSLYSAVSGVKAHQTYLDVTGNNIANVNTVGFKRDVIQFRDMIYQTLKGASAPNNAVPIGGVNPAQVGLGVGIGSIETVHTQGSVQSTGNPTDMAIQGSGYFVVQNGGQQLYTRAGNFAQDRDGNLVMSGNGYLVQGYAYREQVDPATGLTTRVRDASLSNINIPIGQKIPAKETTVAAFRCNLCSTTKAAIPDMNSIPGGTTKILRPHRYTAYGSVSARYVGSTPPPNGTSGETWFDETARELKFWNAGLATPAWASYVPPKLAGEEDIYYGENTDDTASPTIDDFPTTYYNATAGSGPVAAGRKTVDGAGIPTITSPATTPATPPTSPGQTYLNTETGVIYKANSLGTAWDPALTADAEAGVAYAVKGSTAVYMESMLTPAVGTAVWQNVATPNTTAVTARSGYIMDSSTGASNLFKWNGVSWSNLNDEHGLSPDVDLTSQTSSETNQATIDAFGASMIKSHDWSDKATVYDSLGNPYTMEVVFRKVLTRSADMGNPDGTPRTDPAGAETEWDWYAYYVDADSKVVESFGEGAGTLVFGDDGLLKRSYYWEPTPATPDPNATATTQPEYDWTCREKIIDTEDPEYNASIHDSMVTGKIVADFNVAGAEGSVLSTTPLTYGSNMITLDFLGNAISEALGVEKGAIDGTTQYGSPSTNKIYYQDGYAMGELNDWSVGQDGTVTGIYSNGQQLAISTVALAMFANPQGLNKVGETCFAESSNSGMAQVGIPGSGGAGTIKGSSIEMSNVDLSEEFVNLIRAQRGFQANTRVVTTSDQVLEELINMKR